jgi:pantothenate kinase type III
MKRDLWPERHYCHVFTFDVVIVVDLGTAVVPVCVDCGRRRPSMSRAA